MQPTARVTVVQLRRGRLDDSAVRSGEGEGPKERSNSAQTVVSTSSKTIEGALCVATEHSDACGLLACGGPSRFGHPRLLGYGGKLIKCAGTSTKSGEGRVWTIQELPRRVEFEHFTVSEDQDFVVVRDGVQPV